MTEPKKPKKPGATVECAHCKRVILKREACSMQFGRNYSRVCQECIRGMMGLEPRKP